MKDLTKLSASKLQAAYDKAFDRQSAKRSALINAGFGNYRMSDIRDHAEKTGCKLCLAFIKADETFVAIVDEMKRRETYHGTLKPIRNR